MEPCGATGLLRSVAVRAEHQGEGRGSEIVRAVLERTDAQGLRHVYLLTTTAAPFFEAFGFRPLPRAEAPDSIRRTREFSALCPDSAVLMRRSL